MRFPDLPVLALILVLLPRFTAASTLSQPSNPAPTCPYRTVNYITHSLPQQCLPSTRKVNLTAGTMETAAGPNTPGSATSSSPLSAPTGAAHPTAPTNDTTLEPPPPPPSTSSLSATSTTTQPTAPNTQVASPEGEDVSPLEEGKFLSFEDWKRENLKKSGQSDQIGHRPAAEPSEPRKRSSMDQGSLDSLGDDAEIDLDFSGFVSDGLDTINQPKPRPPQPASDSATVLEPDRGPRAGLRSKDAGKTCKERSNYASFDCGADVIKYNPEAKSVLAILGKNKDSYMLNECSAQNKHVILELCNHIAIDTIVVANFEFFSSIFRTFRVTVSDKYPVKADKWKSIGIFEARNTREVQAFLVENPVIWARYVRIEFLTHYGNEYYCPVSLVRIHGTTMLEEYNHDLESLQIEDDLESEVTHASHASLPKSVTSATAVETKPTSTDSSIAVPVKDQMGSTTQDNGTITEQDSIASPITEMTTSSISETVSPDTSTTSSNSSQTMDNGKQPPVLNNCTSEGNISYTEHSANIAQMTSNATSLATADPTNSTNNINSTSSSAAKSSTTATTNENQVSVGSNTTSVQSNNSSSVKTTTTSSSVNSTKASGSSTQAAPAAPTMQESFFKSVQKRLQMLESNSSLSLQYIEEQSRALRDAFRKVEQRQLAKTTSFLDHLNATVLNELRDFRQQYDQLWQSTVIELEMQRERYQQENGDINARLGVLADELIFQKRMAFLQMMLILTCLGLIIFSKGNLNTYLELPLVQSVLARSPSSKWSNTPSLGTPNHSPAVTRNNSARGGKRHGILKGHQRAASEDSTLDAPSPSDLYSPPTPVSLGETSDGDDDVVDGGGLDNGLLGDPQFDPRLIERPSTSPPELAGTETPSTPVEELDMRDASIDSILQAGSNNAYITPPQVTIEAATPPSKQLKWRLPDG